MSRNKALSRDVLQGSVVAHWVQRCLQRLAMSWRALADHLVQHRWIATNLRVLHEQPLRACGETLIVAVVTNMSWLTLRGQAVGFLGLVFRSGLLLVGLSACTSTTTWSTVKTTSLILQWIRQVLRGRA